MKKNRAFSFTILGAEFFSAVQKIPFKERGEFVTQLAADFITLEPVTEYGKQVISETVEKIGKQSEYGKLGGKPKHRHPKGTLKAPYEEPIDTLKAPLTQKNKEKENTILDVVLPDWLPNDAWNAYVEMRKKLKKPLTDYASKLRIADLQKMKDAGQDPVAVLNQSTVNAWTDLYPIGRNSKVNHVADVQRYN